MKNLTPHAINIMNTNGEVVTFPASGVLARVSTSTVEVGQVDGINVVRTVYGQVEGVPAPGTERFIVSAMVLGRLGQEYSGWAFAPRTDGTAVRLPNGQIDYVVGLVTV